MTTCSDCHGEVTRTTLVDLVNSKHPAALQLRPMVTVYGGGAAVWLCPTCRRLDILTCLVEDPKPSAGAWGRPYRRAGAR